MKTDVEVETELICNHLINPPLEEPFFLLIQTFLFFHSDISASLSAFFCVNWTKL